MKRQQFKEIEHRFDPEFYATTVSTRARGYLEKVFEEIPRAEGLEHLASIPEDANRVYIGLHKSHLDYILIPYNLYHNDQQPPAIAGGDNLFKRLGPFNFDNMIRKARGYKIIRKPKSREHHKQVLRQLREYTTHLFANGEDILIFPEAGRSYHGGSNPFSDGSFNVLVSAAQQAGRTVAFVPVVASYERVPEDRFFESFQKYKDNPTLARKICYYATDWPSIYLQKFNSKSHTFGQATVRFGEPHIHVPDNSEPYNSRAIIKGLMKQRCNGLVEVTSTSLLAHALEGERKMSFDDAAYGIAKRLEIVNDEGISRGLLPSDNVLEIIDRAFAFLSKPFRRFVTFEGNKLQVHRPDVVNYYANIIDHHFSHDKDRAGKSFLTAPDKFSL